MGPLHYTDQHLGSQKDSGAKTKLRACSSPSAPATPPHPCSPLHPAWRLYGSPLQISGDRSAQGLCPRAAMCVHIFREHSFGRLKDQFGLSVVGLAGKEMVKVSFLLTTHQECVVRAFKRLGGFEAKRLQPQSKGFTHVPVFQMITHI